MKTTWTLEGLRAQFKQQMKNVEILRDMDAPMRVENAALRRAIKVGRRLLRAQDEVRQLRKWFS